MAEDFIIMEEVETITSWGLLWLAMDLPIPYCAIAVFIITGLQMEEEYIMMEQVGLVLVLPPVPV